MNHRTNSKIKPAEQFRSEPPLSEANQSYQQGLAAYQQGKLTESLAWLQQAIALDPQQAEVYGLAGTVFCRLGEVNQGIAAYQQALDLQPAALDARYNLAIALQKNNQAEAAIAQYRQILQHYPTHIATSYQLGNALQTQQQFTAAIEYYQQAIQLLNQPAALLPINQAFAVRVEAIWYNLGIAWQALQEMSSALHAYEQALAIRPDYSEAHNALGTLLEQQQAEVALDHYQQALQHSPHYLPALINLGNLQMQQRHWQAAALTFRQVLQQDSENLKAIDALLRIALQTADWTELEALTQQLWQIGEHRICTDITIYNSLSLPLTATQLQTLATNHAQAIEQKVASLRQQLNFTREPSASKRLRLGYVSGDYRYQAIAFLIGRLFELHDRQQFEVFAYSLGPDDGSVYRRKFETDSDCFRDISQLSLQQVAQQIDDDGIDILIDLEGYTQYARPEIYALRPAPLIVAYLGHPGTMGASYIDYLLTDSVITPRQLEPQAQGIVENCLYLPDSYLISNNQESIAEGMPKRSDFGLPDNAFVFCSFNKIQKIEPGVFASWMRILRQVPESVLWLWQFDPLAQQNLVAAAAAAGIKENRLVFAEQLPRAEYLARYQCADLFLDTFSQAAGVVSVDVLWSGLPLLTLAGKTFVSRLAASSLTAVGLPELIATSPAEYECQAIDLATHPEKLTALRQRLIEGRTNSNLFNTERTVRHLEAAYQQIWQRYQAGQPAQSLSIPAVDSPIHNANPAGGSDTRIAAPLMPELTSSNLQQPDVPMVLYIPDVLTSEELAYITARLATAKFSDGKLTAGQYGESIKSNTQLDPTDQAALELSQIVVAAMIRNSVFQAAIRPKVIRPPLFSRYQEGMAYGTHIDNPLMGSPATVRSDVSVTLFLSDPASYAGGELVLEGYQTEMPIKLAAGSIVVYPSSFLHRVEPITTGVRLAAVTWIQSLVRDPAERELLFDLDRARQAMFDKYGKTHEFNLISKTYANLVRKWSE